MQLALDHLTDRHFRSIVDLVQTQVGIQLPPGKRGMVESRLRKRVRALDLDGLEAYGRLVFDEGVIDAEFPFLVDCMTTNKTDFFREPAHFNFLRDEAVPQLLARRGGSGPARLKLWSAASSNGAEVYTMAMVLHDMAQLGRKFAFSILGTDISTEMVADAEAAIYPNEMLDAVPPDLRRRYVMVARDPDRKEGRIVPELRSLTRFQNLNLMDANYGIDRDVDVIFCRNVLIYFDKPTQKAVVERLSKHLRPGGYIVVGHSEAMAGAAATGLVQVSSTVFQR